jgi:spermidine synthase
MTCFFVSGMAGLIYQIAWSRYLALFLGHTSYSVMAVLVAFMGGLAVGNGWLGPYADRIRRPLAFYAWLEIGIGMYALAFPSYYSFCHQSYITFARSWHLGANGLLALKFGFSLLSILLPTVLMGATMPLLAKFVTRSLDELRGRVAALYFINSVGAVAGCCVTAFWWIPDFGLEMSVLLGAVLNIGAGLAALALSHYVGEGKFTAPYPTSERVETREEQFTQGELKLALAAIGISGFAAMLYEITWTRLLALVLGSSTHAFTLMLITFISGIAAGSWIICYWRGARCSLTSFAWAELSLAGTIFASMFFYEWLPYWFVKLAGLLARQEEAYPLYALLQMLICFLVMFVPTIFLGMTLPLASRVATLQLAETGRSVGRVYAVNTVGTVLGTVFTGLWLMPSLGLARTLALGVILNFLIGIIILFRRSSGRAWRVAATCALIAMGTVWLTARHFDPAWQRVLTLGLWRFPAPPADAASYWKVALAENMRFYKDGAGATVSVYSWKEGLIEHLSLKVNGKTDANSKSDVPTQVLLGHLPMLLKPEAKDVLVVGLGSGLTCSAVACHPSLRKLDVVEISPEVVSAARLFAHHNNNVLDDPKLHLVVDDAKSFLQISPQQYEVIISEPSNPWMAGVAGVFSREFYQDCESRLTPDGLIVQWIHLNETSDAALNLVLATFTSVFPHTSIWQGAPKDLLLVGSRSPIQVNLEATAQRFNHSKVKRDLERLGMTRIPVFLSCELVSQQNGRFLFPTDTRLHSDFYPVLEFAAQKAFFVRSKAEDWRAFDETSSPRATTLLAEYVSKHPLDEDDFMAFAKAYGGHRLFRTPLLRSLALRWLQDFPNAVAPLEILTFLSDNADPAELQVLRLAPFREAILQRAPEDPDLLSSYAKLLMQTYRAQRSFFFKPPTTDLTNILNTLLRIDNANSPLYYCYLAELAWDRGDDNACFLYGSRVFNRNTSNPASFNLDPDAPTLVLTRMIEGLLRSGKVSEAWNLCVQSRADGHIMKKSTPTHRVLEMTCRKTESAATQEKATIQN